MGDRDHACVARLRPRGRRHRRPTPGHHDPTDQTNTAYGWAKTDTNVFRTALPGKLVPQQATYVGTVDNFLANRQTMGESDGYNRTTSDYWTEVQLREQQYPQPPVVFVVQQFYKGATPEEIAAAMAQGTEVGPGVVVLNGSGLYAPPSDVVSSAQAAGDATKQALVTHPGPLANPLHTVRVLFGLFLLVVLPGLIAASPFLSRGAAYFKAFEKYFAEHPEAVAEQ